MKSNESHCWLLDLDRTISSVDTVMVAVEYVCNKLDINYDNIKQQQQITESRGESFFVLSAIKKMAPNKFKQFCSKFGAIDHIDSLYSDARRFIDRLVIGNKRFIVITYGDTEWQYLKIKLAGLDTTPYIICDTPKKCDLIESYRSKTGFNIKTNTDYIECTNVTLVDDKLEAFDDIGKNVKGYLIDRKGIILNDLKNAKVIHSFDEILDEA